MREIRRRKTGGYDINCLEVCGMQKAEKVLDIIKRQRGNVTNTTVG